MSDDEPNPNTRTQIADAKALCKKYNGQGALILLVRDDGVIDISTYGDTKVKCRALGWISDLISKNALSPVPFRTLFGWGNNGVPQPLTRVERMVAGIANADVPDYLFGKLPKTK